jgi:hypothetical protein
MIRTEVTLYKLIVFSLLALALSGCAGKSTAPGQRNPLTIGEPATFRNPSVLLQLFVNGERHPSIVIADPSLIALLEEVAGGTDPIFRNAGAGHLTTTGWVNEAIRQLILGRVAKKADFPSGGGRWSSVTWRILNTVAG